MRKIFFRADGNSQMGMGHIVRLLALADMLKDQYHTIFVSKNKNLETLIQIQNTCHEFIAVPDDIDNRKDANNLLSHISKNDIVVLDGYHFDTEYQRTIKKKALSLVSIDDIHQCHFFSDVVINHAGGVTEDKYSTESYTQLYLGLQYALLRKPFRETNLNKEYPNRKLENVLICMGGADPNNDTLGVLKKCNEKNINQLKYFVIIGTAYLYHDELFRYIKTENLSAKILYNLSAEEMVFYMKKCATAITPPSTVAYEYLSVGGTLFLKVIADNQKEMFDFFVGNRLAINFDNFGKATSTFKANELDGLQKNRYIEIFNTLHEKSLHYTS